MFLEIHQAVQYCFLPIYQTRLGNFRYYSTLYLALAGPHAAGVSNSVQFFFHQLVSHQFISCSIHSRFLVSAKMSSPVPVCNLIWRVMLHQSLCIPWVSVTQKPVSNPSTDLSDNFVLSSNFLPQNMKSGEVITGTEAPEPHPNMLGSSEDQSDDFPAITKDVQRYLPSDSYSPFRFLDMMNKRSDQANSQPELRERLGYTTPYRFTEIDDGEEKAPDLQLVNSKKIT